MYSMEEMEWRERWDRVLLAEWHGDEDEQLSGMGKRESAHVFVPHMPVSSPCPPAADACVSPRVSVCALHPNAQVIVYTGGTYKRAA